MTVKKMIKPLLIAAAATTLGGVLGLYVWKQEERPAILEIYVFSLSGGRSMFIRTPEDSRLLVDGGSNGEIIRELTKILPFYSRRIDAVMATNTEGRNLGGLIEVVTRYRVETVYLPAYTLENIGLASPTDQIYSVFLDTVKREGILIKALEAEDVIRPDVKAKIDLMFPVPAKDFVYSKASPPEILFKVSYGQSSVVFLGNATNKIQKYILSREKVLPLDLKSEALIVSHSAAADSLNLLLMEKIKPDYLIYSKVQRAAVASVSDKTKKKPVDPLEYIPSEDRFNIKEKGTVKIVSDGQSLSVFPNE